MSFHAYISFSTRFLNMCPFFIFYLMIHMQDSRSNIQICHPGHLMTAQCPRKIHY